MTITCDNRSRRGQRSAGALLVEYLFSIGIGAMVVSAICAFIIFTARGFTGLMNYTSLENQSRLALDSMTRELRQASTLTDFATNKLVFVNGASNAVTYQYLPTNETLVRIEGNSTKTLLKGCDFLNFAIFSRNTSNGTFNQYPASVQDSNCKLVQVSWICSRTITGTKLNTEAVQTAKIVIRNK